MPSNGPAILFESLRDVLTGRAPMPAQELLALVSATPAALSRFLARDTSGAIVRLGRARATRYALVRDVRGLGGRWPLGRVGRDGSVEVIAEVIAIQGRDVLVRPRPGAPEWLVAGSDQGRFDDLPWYLQDLRPQGFMGRAFARRVARITALPEDPRDWSADDQWMGLLCHGEDLPGNLLLGRAMVALATAPEAVPVSSVDRYPEIALHAMKGDVVGSSAAGEQPKFSVFVDGPNGPRFVLVKFATMATENGRRWADLLIAEQGALEVLRSAGVAACAGRIVDRGDGRFLELERFDRSGMHGRASAVSLSALDAPFSGAGRRWPVAARRLAKEGVITDATFAQIERLEAFGIAIANTDRHFGNLAFSLDRGFPAELAPVYDMLPMAFAPGPHGPEPYARPPITFPADLSSDAVAWARTHARIFWTRLAEDFRVSPDFRAVARDLANA